MKLRNTCTNIAKCSMNPNIIAKLANTKCARLILCPIHDTNATNTVMIKNGKYTSLASISDNRLHDPPENVKILPSGQSTWHVSSNNINSSEHLKQRSGVSTSQNRQPSLQPVHWLVFKLILVPSGHSLRQLTPNL